MRTAAMRLGHIRRALPSPITDEAVDIDRLWDLYLWIAYAVTAIVAALIIIIVMRFRRRGADLPPQKHYNIPAEVAYTVVPLLVVIGLFAVSFSTTNVIDRVDDHPDLVVDVTAFQWQWQFGYPDADVTAVGTDAIEPVLVLPADASIRFDLRSLDVVHSFWITAFRFKRDIIPGRPGRFSVHMGADAAGWYPNTGVCAEFCGLDHALMRFSVLVLEPAAFEAWLSSQPIDAPVVVDPAAIDPTAVMHPVIEVGS